MVSYVEALKRGLVFGFSPARWLPIFIVDMVFFSGAVGIFLSSPDTTAGVLALLSNPSATGNLARLGAGLIGLGAVWFLVRLWVTGAIIHQTHKEKEFDKSWAVSRRRFVSLLGAMVFVLALTVAVGMVPFLSIPLSMVVRTVFLWPAGFFSFSLYYPFVLQGVVLKGKSSVGGLKDSVRLFRDHLDPVWKGEKGAGKGLFIVLSVVHFVLAAYFFLSGAWQVGIAFILGGILCLYSTVYRMWLSVSILAGIITLIFAIPVFIIGVSSATPDIFLLAGNALPALLLYFLSKPQVLLVMGGVFLVGSSIATVLTLKVQTEFYVQMKKKLGIFF